MRAPALANPHHPSRGGRAYVASLCIVAGGCQFAPGAFAIIDAATDAAAVTLHDSSMPLDAVPDAAPDAFAGAAVRVNIGGVAYAGLDYPGVWAADLGVCPGAATLAVNADVNQTNDDALFQSAVVGDSVHCTVGGLPRGTYDVTLLFAEIGPVPCGASPVARSFSIALENTVALPGFDLSIEGGGCALVGKPGGPVARVFSVAVIDGALSLELVQVAPGQPALLSAVQAIQTARL